MPRRWKNSDDNTVFSDRVKNKKLEQLRMEFIPGYGKKKYKKFQKNESNESQPQKSNKNLKND